MTGPRPIPKQFASSSESHILSLILCNWALSTQHQHLPSMPRTNIPVAALLVLLLSQAQQGGQAGGHILCF